MNAAPSRRPRWAAPLLILAVAPLVSACAPGDAQPVPEAAAAPVRTAPVVRAEIRRPVTATGSFGPRDEHALGFKVGGVVASVAVDAGETVAAGQLLASLDLREMDAALAKARSAAEKARRDLARARALYADSVVTLSQLQDAETAAQVAEAGLEAAAFDREHARVTSPVDGVVLERRVEVGELAAPGATALVVGSRARGAVVRVGLSDRDVVRVRVGAPAEARFDALPGRVFPGRVSEVGAAATAGAGTWAVEVSLEGAEALRAGMIGEVAIESEESVEAALVPVEALLEADGERGTVFVLEGDRAVRRAVRIAFLEGDRVALLEGVEGVAEVVTDGAAWLTDGEVVEVVR